MGVSTAQLSLLTPPLLGAALGTAWAQSPQSPSYSIPGVFPLLQPLQGSPSLPAQSGVGAGVQMSHEGALEGVVVQAGSHPVATGNGVQWVRPRALCLPHSELTAGHAPHMAIRRPCRLGKAGGPGG